MNKVARSDFSPTENNARAAAGGEHQPASAGFYQQRGHVSPRQEALHGRE